MVACAHSALAHSANVRSVSFTKDYPRTLYAGFVNPPDRNVGGMSLVVAPMRGRPTQFVIEYRMWLAKSERPGVPNLADLNAPEVEAAGAQLLRAVHAECAPTGPGEPVCTKVYMNQTLTGRCSIGI